jgi:putative PIN family toxin of toxin-antitoxin system
MSRPRVVLDTNVYISGLLFGGIPAEILAQATEGDFVLCVSESIRDEVTATLREKFKQSEDQIREGCQPLWEVAEFVESTTRLRIITADPDDNRILECAVDGKADIVVTGDDHLLRLARSPQQPPIDRIRIMILRRFIDEQIP